MIAEILKMIEAVNPDDNAKLDEIDARIWCFLNGARFKRMLSNKYPNLAPTRFSFYQNASIDYKLLTYPIKYTRSRDALVEIEHKAWRIENVFYDAEENRNISILYRMMPFYNKDPFIHSPYLPTWELAQLHVILQTHGYQRGDL